MFVDRRAELDFLNAILKQQHPGPGQLVLLYGRRRVGKTFLLRHWVKDTDFPHTYWSAQKESAALQRRRLFNQVTGIEQAQFDSWSDCWQAIANFLTGRRHLLIIDEFSYAVEADSGMLSSLQHVWDHTFKDSQLALILCGSHIHAMESLLTQQSPLFGRFTGQWCLRPLPYASLQEFFPRWSAEERVSAYAILGGVPAYWRWLDPEQSLLDNIRRILSPGSLFLAEPTFLLYDELREPTTYLSIIRALGTGSHSLSEIANATMISSHNLSVYLARLRELHLVERRLPITIHPAKRSRSRRGRYHLLDPFFRFYFRFVSPYWADLEYQPENVLAKIYAGLRGFVGETAFEELCRQWALKQSRADRIPFVVRECGSHWSSSVQVDVVGLNWEDRGVLIGECKWEKKAVGKKAITTLVERKTPQVLKHLPALGENWQVQRIFFARAGVTPAAQTAAQELGVELVDLAVLDADLTRFCRPDASGFRARHLTAR